MYSSRMQLSQMREKSPELSQFRDNNAITRTELGRTHLLRRVKQVPRHGNSVIWIILHSGSGPDHSQKVTFVFTIYPQTVNVEHRFATSVAILPITNRQTREQGSGVVRIDPLRFLAGCRTRRLNQV